MSVQTGQTLFLHEVTLGEWGRFAIVLPARTPQDAVTIARMMYGIFHVAPFQEEEALLPPGTPKSPQLREPERLIGYLAELYHRMTLAGPDRRVFAREFDIVESQVDYLRQAGHGRFNPALRLHDRLVTARRQPHHIVEAGWLRRAPANPPEKATQLRARHVLKFRDLTTRAAIAYAQQAGAPHAHKPASPQAGQENVLHREWRALKNEHAHVNPSPDPRPSQAATTQITYFDRLARRARAPKAPAPTPEQDNAPDYDMD